MAGNHNLSLFYVYNFPLFCIYIRFKAYHARMGWGCKYVYAYLMHPGSMPHSVSAYIYHGAGASHPIYVYTLLFATSGVWLGTGGSLTSVRWNIHQHRYCKDGSLFTQHIRFAPDKANHAQNFILPWKHSTPHMWHCGERNALPCTSMVAMEYRETFCWHSQRRNPHS